MKPYPIGAEADAPIVPAMETLKGLPLRLTGRGGTLRVWLGSDGDVAKLEADVRTVSEAWNGALPALAVALGEVARHHKLEVRVIPRIDEEGSTVVVVFGTKRARTR